MRGRTWDTKVITIRTRGPFGTKAQTGKLERLVAKGWEVASSKGAPFGAQTTTYVLRRPR